MNLFLLFQKDLRNKVLRVHACFQQLTEKNVPIFSIATPLASIELAKIVFTASIALEDSYKHK